MRETLEAVENQEGFTPAELADAPECPAGFDYLWAWFLRLNSTRGAGFGSSAISETELRSFFLNRSITPHQWEIDLLVKLDSISREKEKGPPQPEDEEQ